MKEWVARLLEEKNTLAERQRKLTAFLNSKAPINERQRDLMERQVKVMQAYENILHERIVLEAELNKKKEI
jgi:hypothetical protein